ncbi:MAG: shikimate kinase [Spirochaetes bacterium]|nr:shikimate kinase [Spirochaetota bacterium]
MDHRRKNKPRRGGGARTKIHPPKKPRIALIGFRGVGKSAIARRLAEYWQIPLLSLDEKIERDEGMRIEEIVRSRGWQYFRDREYAALATAAETDRLLLDCGGGIVEEAEGLRSDRKMQILKEKFFCIYIAVNEEKMLYRLQNLARNASRPDLSPADSPQNLLEVFKRREPLYLEIAHTVVDISDTNIAESALRITQMFK